MSHHGDIEKEKEYNQNKQWLNRLADEVRNTPPTGSDFENRYWLESNKEKILRTRKLIDLLK